MSTGAIIAVVAAVVIVAAIIAAVTMRRGSGGVGLKRRFGPEYERTLAKNDGDIRATKRELTERVQRYGDIEKRALPEQAQEQYVSQWAAVQAKFVDDPAEAVGEADQLIARLAADIGYPAADSPDHLDALSVHHPHHVHGYRDAHAVSAQSGGKHGTEDLRKSLVAARGMFDDMLHTGRNVRGGEVSQETAADPETEAAAEQNESKPAFGKRLAALNGRGRTETDQ